jgi:hypothetical protein
MMRLHSVVRDLAVVCLAVSIGWWLRGAGMEVLAQRSSSSSSARGAYLGGDSNLAFQLVGAGPGASLAVYNQANHRLYVYNRVGEGNSYISCGYSFTIANPGTAIQRENCPVGDLMPKD